MPFSSSYLSHLEGWIGPLPVVFAGFPCSRPSTCRWCGGYRRNRIPLCKALAPGSDWSPEPCCDRGARGVGEDIPGGKNDGHVIKNIRGLFLKLCLGGSWRLAFKCEIRVGDIEALRQERLERNSWNCHKKQLSFKQL